MYKTYKDRDDVEKWIKLSKSNYSPEYIKENFSGSGDSNKVLKVIEVALKSKSTVKIIIEKSSDGNIDYKIDQE